MWFKRRSSRPSVQKNSSSRQSVSLPASAPTSSPRLPLVPHTVLDPQASQSSISAGESDDTNPSHSSSSSEYSINSLLSKQMNARKVFSHESSESNTRSSYIPGTLPSYNHSAPSSSGTPYQSSQSTYTNHRDLYTHNALNSFSFGAAPSSSSYSLPVDPLANEGYSDESIKLMDTTPRPSVVVNNQSLNIRSHPSQSPGKADPPSSSRHQSSAGGLTQEDHPRGRPVDVASFHTNNTSSASASMSSLCSVSASNSRAGSRTSRHTTPQTSANDLTSDDDDHQHPIPPLAQIPSTKAETEGNNFYSEEEFDDDSDYDQDIDVGSEINEGSDHGTFIDYGGSSENFGSRFLYEERRASAAMFIPGTPNSRNGRNREGSITTVRRPSRSLEDLGSFTFATISNLSQTHPISPTSVPESEGDWRDLRKRSLQRDNGIHHSNNGVSVITTSSAVSFGLQSNTTSSSLSDATEGFDLKWSNNYANGITGIDSSEMSDIVVKLASSGRRPSALSYLTNRRMSEVSGSDLFVKNLYAWDEATYGTQKQLWTFKRVKDIPLVAPDLPKFKNTRLSISSSRLGGSVMNEHGNYGERDDHKEKEKPYGKEKDRESHLWKGMPPDSAELWRNNQTGMFKVFRKNRPVVEPGKPAQQRLNIYRITNDLKRSSGIEEGPQVTIHKHSKATAFSINRHYLPKEKSNPVPPRASANTRASAPISAMQGKKPARMILLAPRKVQEAYTSTTTTRKLESHGLLDNSGRGSPRDWERMRKEREREKTKERKKSKNSKESKSKDKGRGRSDQSSAGSVTAVSIDVSSTLTGSSSYTPAPLPANYPPSSIYHPLPSLNGYSDRPPRPASYRCHSSRDPLDDDDDDFDDFDGVRRPPTRTPHGEAFGTIPPEALEMLALRQEEQSRGLFGRRKLGRNGHSSHPSPNNVLDSSFVPPWASNSPRYNADYRRIVVDDLNNSFQDVGLLPTASEAKASSSHNSRKQSQRVKQPASADTSVPSSTNTDIFRNIPADSLYMLLPLWPGYSSPHWSKKCSFTVPKIAIEKRLYLLLCYKKPDTPFDKTADGRLKNGESKKRSWNSPTTSHDSVRKDDPHVPLSTFHISARIVTYGDLQGSGIRIPDEGLAIVGSLEEAYKSMPTHVDDTDLFDWMLIGLCSSREAGIEFYPEGLVKMGLCTTDPPVTIKVEDDGSEVSETIFTPTLVGQAVLEMAWSGGMALTSFGSSP